MARYWMQGTLACLTRHGAEHLAEKLHAAASDDVNTRRVMVNMVEEKSHGGKGVSGDRVVMAYCRIGERSSHTWFVLKYLLGFANARNFDGSWTE